MVAELAREAPRAERRPSRLVTISQVLGLAGAPTEAVGVRDVVQLVADEVLPAVGSRALVPLRAQGGRLHVLGHRGHRDPHVVERFDGLPLSERAPGTHALNSGVLAFFEHREQLERLYPRRPETSDGFAAWAYLPLIASGRPVGTWVLAHAGPHPFPADERAMLTSLGGLIVRALERALLYDAGHRPAHGRQQALLPHSLMPPPGIEAAARCLPATHGMEIGGDFYDLVPTRPPAAAVIGDVQGHNVTAAGLMGQIRTGVRAYTPVGAGSARGDGQHQPAADRSRCRTVRRLAVSAAGPDGRVRVLDLAGARCWGSTPRPGIRRPRCPWPPARCWSCTPTGSWSHPASTSRTHWSASAPCRRRPATGRWRLADEVVRHSTAARGRVDDVAVLLLRARDDG
ncbi:hypothetical protein GCM10009787_14040 [Streptomyces bangladeshensis]|uniref:GAF domain-containing protein n=1 Tax=Streptomyces bangladeshensis TaxID=295352 RepID=A0ABP5N4L5_9ACTN